MRKVVDTVGLYEPGCQGGESRGTLLATFLATFLARLLAGYAAVYALAPRGVLHDRAHRPHLVYPLSILVGPPDRRLYLARERSQGLARLGIS